MSVPREQVLSSSSTAFAARLFPTAQDQILPASCAGVSVPPSVGVPVPPSVGVPATARPSPAALGPFPHRKPAESKRQIPWKAHRCARAVHRAEQRWVCGSHRWCCPRETPVCLCLVGCRCRSSRRCPFPAHHWDLSAQELTSTGWQLQVGGTLCRSIHGVRMAPPRATPALPSVSPSLRKGAQRRAQQGGGQSTQCPLPGGSTHCRTARGCSPLWPQRQMPGRAQEKPGKYLKT